MSDRSKPSKVLIIGSGPIIIGQAAEFDYAGAQACKAMREEGITSVLVNSNPATIMTDEEIADIVYIEPLNVDTLTRIIEKERPDGLLPTLGGQTGLNLAIALADKGILDKYNVKSLGTSIRTIRNAEDRELFKQLLVDIGEPVLKSISITSPQQAEEATSELGLPLIIRPAYTLGGTGGGMVYNMEELKTAVAGGLAASPINQVLLEKSVAGWKEIEYEVMRDGADNCITVCNMENFDPMGTHTGDSIVIAPSQTLNNKEYQMLRTASLKIIRALGVEGGCNVQFALDPTSSKYYVIEVNPRVSRSSALASKATGYPIARVASKIAVGRTLDEIPNQVTGKTMASFEPALDYVVVKIPHWPFDKFSSSNRIIGTQMKATGEVMAIDRCFEAALQKAVRSLESNRKTLLWEDSSWKQANSIDAYPLVPNELRLWAIMAALRRGINPELIAERTHIDMWFIARLKNIVDMEEIIRFKPLTPELLSRAKRLGFSDEQIGALTNRNPAQLREMRIVNSIEPVYKIVDTCAAEFDASTPYFYSTYEQEDEACPTTNRKKAMVIGSGPIRIGQGIEFDYCCVHASFALRDEGYETIMVNCNPETVSTDFDTSDKLYFEPLTVEDVLNIYNKEKPMGVIIQFGGQTPLNIAAELEKAGVNVLGTSVNSIDIASDRGRFKQMMVKYGIPMPESETVCSLDEALIVAERIGYPLIVRPSYVLGGRGMEIVHDEEELRRYVSAAVSVTQGRPVLIERYLENAIETEADALSDGEEVFIPAIMEHIEYAGVHSGDAACVIPSVNLPPKHIDTINRYTRRIASELQVVGLINIQYAICQDIVYVIEANPRASRTIPVVSKICAIPMANLATQLMMGKKIKDLKLKQRAIPHFGVKESVFPFNMFPEVDPLLRPEMRSTGEVLGIANSFGLAFWKAQEAVSRLPTEGVVLLTVSERDRQMAGKVAFRFHSLGFKIKATAGTHTFLTSLNIPSELILKEHEGRPNITDAIRNKEIQLVINTPEGKQSKYDDSYIRKAAIKYKVPYITTLTAAMAAAQGISAFRDGKPGVKSLQSYHADIK